MSDTVLLDLDELLDEAMVGAALATGRDPRLVARQFGAAAVAADLRDVRLDGWANVWSVEDDAYLAQWAGVLGDEELAARMGRSVTAVRVRGKRKGLPAPTKHPDYITAQGAARALGVDVKSVCCLIERGILPAELAPLSNRKMWRIGRAAFTAWALRPANWVYFIRSVRRPERIRDEALRRLIVRRVAVWGDEWWSIGQVAAYHGVISNDVARYIYAGRITSAVQWGNCWVLRSEATRPGLRFYKGKGAGVFERAGSPAGDAFLVLAAAVGIPARQIGRLMGRRTSDGVKYRLDGIRRRGLAPWLIRAYELPVEQGADGRLWADWRAVAHRFPLLAAAWGKLARGEGIDDGERMLLKGVALSFMRYHHPDDALTARWGDLVAAAELCGKRAR